MIQGFLTEECKKIVPELRWSTDYYALDDNTGTVYAEAGSPPRVEGEVDTRYPSYMVFVRSSDWDLARRATERIRNRLHKRSNFKATEKQYDSRDNVIGEKSYHVFLLVASTEPLRLGPTNNVMEYSINFDVTLKEE